MFPGKERDMHLTQVPVQVLVSLIEDGVKKLRALDEDKTKKVTDTPQRDSELVAMLDHLHSGRPYLYIRKATRSGTNYKTMPRLKLKVEIF